MPVLTPADLKFFDEQGYVLVPQAVPRENCEAVIDAIFAHVGLDRSQPDTWYNGKLDQSYGGMVQMFHHPSMYANRQHPRVYEAFCDILGDHRLAVWLDRVSFKLPVRPNFPAKNDNGFTHLDMTLNKDSTGPFPLALQGVLYLNDVTVDQGGFHCIPGFHRTLREWARSPMDQRCPEPPDFSKIEPTPIPGHAGDLLIWDQFLPHGNGRNTTRTPRFAQYISMHRRDRLKPDQLEKNRHVWSLSIPTFDASLPRENGGHPVELSPLGRKLVGVDAWD